MLKSFVGIIPKWLFDWEWQMGQNKNKKHFLIWIRCGGAGEGMGVQKWRATKEVANRMLDSQPPTLSTHPDPTEYKTFLILILQILRRGGYSTYQIPAQHCLYNSAYIIETSGYPWRSDTIRPCLQARVAAFGSQDLGFRTSIFGSHDLVFRPSINGHWVSRPQQTQRYRTLKAFHPTVVDQCSVLFLIFFPSLFSASIVTFLYVQWSQTHKRMQQAKLYIWYP
jgi:hypothetical protein